MHIQLVEIKKGKSLPRVVVLSDTLGYVIATDTNELDLTTIRSDTEWWKKILNVRKLGVVVDSQVDTAKGVIESNDRAQILDAIERGGEVFYVTFVHRIDGRPVFFSLYRGGKLSLSPEDQEYLKIIASLLEP